jgi:mono/diheme cytochrome c family protein
MRRVRVMGVAGGLRLRAVLAGAMGFTAAGLLLAALTGKPTPVQAAAAADDAASLAFYSQKVVPVFQANCYRCHGGMNHRGGFQMDTRAGMAKGGHDGAVIVPGHPEQSLLVKLIRHEGPKNDPMPMPPHKDKISDADIATVEQWVRAGAIMPPDVPK